QVLALSVDPHRLYIERGLPAAFYYHISPWLYFDRDISHLLNRPRELIEVLGSRSPAELFTPARASTFAFPVIDLVGVNREAVVGGMIGSLTAPDGSGNLCAGGAWLAGWQRESGQEAVRKYHVLNSLRPWWISQWYLLPEERPVDLPATGSLLGGILL